ncbi:hypothetical protein BEN49_23815 [Hymenobacter coccineus]|uniref:Uncharacterized protein n=1 Tax=Hymenobacter coccineus TaxID=1908235 RepID=A0A1G1TGX5_9BACT|nr:hypothetical protein BEN49_23815 [Hymenobacter coccineus]
MGAVGAVAAGAGAVVDGASAGTVVAVSSAFLAPQAVSKPSSPASANWEREVGFMKESQG